MPCGWEGNRRSGVALAMRHRLSGLSTYELNDQRKRAEHATYAFCGVRHLYIYYNIATAMTTATDGVA